MRPTTLIRRLTETCLGGVPPPPTPPLHLRPWLQQVDIRMRSHALLQLADNKSAASCCKLIVQTCYQQACWKLFQQIVTSFLYVCMVNTIYLFSFVETPRKFIIAELSIRKLGSSSVLLALMKIRAYGSKALQ